MKYFGILIVSALIIFGVVQVVESKDINDEISVIPTISSPQCLPGDYNGLCFDALDDCKLTGDCEWFCNSFGTCQQGTIDDCVEYENECLENGGQACTDASNCWCMVAHNEAAYYEYCIPHGF